MKKMHKFAMRAKRLKRVLGVAGIAALIIAVGLASPAGADPAITPDEWGMDDGIGVGERVAGTPCLASESHQWAEPADGSRYALWCPPPAFVWVSVEPWAQR